MKIFNSTVLGAAACLVALSGAQAADLPVKAKAVEYVRICSLYGNGFYFIPGTDTCIKLGGYLRADVTFNGGGIQGTPAWSGLAGQKSRLSNYYFARARENLNVDTRTATEYGVVRTYFDVNFSWTTGTYAAAAAGGVGGTTYSASPLKPTALPQAAGSPSTSRSSSSPASRSAGLYRCSTHPSPAIPPTSLTRSSAATPIKPA